MADRCNGTETKLCARAVNVLRVLNADHQNASNDKTFVKATILGIGLLKPIEQNQKVPNEQFAFIKG